MTLLIEGSTQEWLFTYKRYFMTDLMYSSINTYNDVQEDGSKEEQLHQRPTSRFLLMSSPFPDYHGDHEE